MPTGLEARCRRYLKEIVSLSSGIRNTFLDYALHNRNFDISERLRNQLETIRVSADAILGAFAKASRTSSTLDERVTDWLDSGGPYSCLGKLREMNDTFKPVDDTEDSSPPPMPDTDQLAAAEVFFDNHKNIFHFLLTPKVWNCERPGPSPPEASQAIPSVTNDDQIAQTSSITTEHENGPQPMTRRKKEILHQKVGEISRWLAPMECAHKHKDGLRLRQEGTCKWFPNTDAYKKWQTPGNRFLWLHGKGGCGKSVLIASTIEHLQGTLKDKEVIAFFYCDFQNKRSTSSTELMRSLLSQLLHHICTHGDDTGDFLDKILKEKAEGTLSLDDLEKLGKVVSRAASYFCYEPFIVIDALDECADIESLLPVLVTWSRADVRLLVTSRPDQTIMDSFKGLQSLSFENVIEEVKVDITLHIKRELDSHNRLRSAILEMKDEIDAKLTHRAEGRFRWVQCQLDILKQCTTGEELTEALNDLPGELEVTYERILEAIDERKPEGKLARRVLALLMVAIEPLQLAQIVDVLSMDFRKQEHVLEARRWLEARLLQSLSSLVSHSEETDVLAISHYSVNEYLASRSALSFYRIIAHEAHAEAARICMGYISVFLKAENNLGLSERFPMLYYAFSSGFRHLAFVDSESIVALEALQFFGLDVRHHPSHWDRLCESREEVLDWPFTLWPSSKHDFILYTLIAYSTPGLLQTFLSTNFPLRPRTGTNPLVYAADLRKTEHALILLTYGADVNARGLVVDDSRHASPLEVAIDLGDDVLVGELLHRGCLVTSELVSTAICMPWCSTQVLVQLMQTDEFTEWALTIGDEKLYRGVFNSARPNARDSRRTDEDHVALARRLCQLGLKLSAEGQFGKELVERALHAAHISMLEFLLPPDEPPPAEFLITASTGDTPETVAVVRFLLQKEVDVNVVSDETEDTALHLAAMCPWEPRSLELTKLLIDAGCSPHIENSDGETPLVAAVTHGHYLVVELLLSCNVPLPSGILHTALGRRRRDCRMIELLILRGANIHTVTGSAENSVLHHTMLGHEIMDDEDENEDEEINYEREESECLDLVKRFIEAGCDPTTRNSRGKTALEIAVECNFASVVDLLLPLDVTLPPDILLSAVQQGWTFEMVERLICRGADVHSISSSRDTVLHFALNSHYDEETCHKLMERFIRAGCDPTVRNFAGKIVLEMAMKRYFTSVVAILLSPKLPLPPNVLSIVMQQRTTLEMVKYLVRRGADVHSTSSSGDTVLHLALRWFYDEGTCYKLVEGFIRAGCDPTVCNSTGKTALEMAVERHFTSVVEILLPPEFPPPPNVLSIMIRQCTTLELVECFIHRGADVHSTSFSGDTVLHLALSSHYDEGMCHKLVERFIDAGCDPTARNFAGKTALEIAITRNFTSVVDLLLSLSVLLPPYILLSVVQQGLTVTTVERLMRRGADVHSTSSSGDTLLHLALSLHYDEGTCHKLVERFIDAGCDPTARNFSGKSALEIAMERSFASVVELLLSPELPLPSDVLLIMMRQSTTLEMVERLIQRGADVHPTTPEGNTVLHLALRRYYDEGTCYKLMERFIDAGCDPIARNFAGKTALEIATECNFTSVVELLLSCNVPIPSGVLPIVVRKQSSLAMFQLVIRKGVDVRSAMVDREVIGHLATAVHDESSSHLVKTFVDLGCNPEASCSSERETVFEVAIEHRYTSVFKLLCLCNVLFPSNILLTALRLRSTVEIVDFLLHEGADVHATTSDGNSVLHLVITGYAEETCRHLVKIFIDAGCSPTACNSEGKTVMEAAVERGYASVTELLLSGNASHPSDIKSTTTNGDTSLHFVPGMQLPLRRPDRSQSPRPLQQPVPLQSLQLQVMKRKRTSLAEEDNQLVNCQSTLPDSKRLRFHLGVDQPPSVGYPHGSQQMMARSEPDPMLGGSLDNFFSSSASKQGLPSSSGGTQVPTARATGSGAIAPAVASNTPAISSATQSTIMSPEEPAKRLAIEFMQSVARALDDFVEVTTSPLTTESTQPEDPDSGSSVIVEDTISISSDAGEWSDDVLVID